MSHSKICINIKTLSNSIKCFQGTEKFSMLKIIWLQTPFRIVNFCNVVLDIYRFVLLKKILIYDLPMHKIVFDTLYKIKRYQTRKNR